MAEVAQRLAVPQDEDQNQMKNDNPSSSKDWSTGLVFLLCNLVVICFTISNAIIKDCQMRHQVSPFEVLLMQSLANMLLSATVAKCAFKTSLYSSIPSGLKSSLILRSCTQVIGFIGFAIANKILALSVWFVIFSSNIFTTAIIGFCFLKERLSPFEVMCMMFAFSGILIIAMSGGASENKSHTNEQEVITKSMFQLGVLFALLATVAQSVIAVVSRMLKQINFAVIMFNQGVAQCISMVLILAFLYISKGDIPFQGYSVPIYCELVLGVVINCTGVNMSCIAYQKANPAIAGLFMYLGVAYHYLVDKLLFQQELSMMQIVGLSMSLTFTILVAIYRMLQQNREKELDDQYVDQEALSK